MDLLKNTSIPRKLTLLVLAAVATALFLSCVAFVINDIRFMRDAMVRQLTSLANVLGSNTAAALTFDDTESAQHVLSSLNVQPSVTKACIYDAEGVVFATYVTGVQTYDFPSTPPSAGYRFTADGHLKVAAAILVGEEQVGTIYLHATLDQVRQQLAHYAEIVLVVLTMSFGTSYLLVSRLQRGISGPILALARTTEQISTNQDYSIRVAKTSDDELGTLYDEFNHMLEQVETGKRALQEAHRRLTQQSEQRMRAIVETAAAAIITIGDDGVIDSCNGASCDLFGYKREELLGAKFTTLLTDADDMSWQEYVRTKLDYDSSSKCASKEIEAQRSDDKVIPLRISLSRLVTDEGWMSTAILRDLSESKRLQRELLQAQRLESIGQLAAGIAHEINTPMQFVNDNIEFLSHCVEK